MKSLLMILILPFLFALHESHVISRFDSSDETAQKIRSNGAQTGRQSSPKVDLSKQDHFEGDIMLPEKKPIDGVKPSAVYESRIWPDKTIPYVISAIYSRNEANLILDAMKSFQSKTCLQFIPRKSEKDYIDIKKTGSGCYSYVGKIGGNQTVSLDDGCLHSSTVKHELMHAIGFYHEQSRTDRDDFVTILFKNIKPGMERNFQKYDAKAVQLLGTPYDLKSIMHYSAYAFAVDRYTPTIIGKKGALPMPSDDFTLTDMLDMVRLYKCPNGSYIEWKEQTWGNGKFVSGSDCDFVATNILQVQSTKFEDCGGLCSANLKCTHFSWQSNGTCSFKVAPRSADPSQVKGSTCGYITQGNFNFNWFNGVNDKWAYDCDFPGNNIRQILARIGQCASQCVSEKECTHYSTYSLSSGSNDQLCSLKRGKNPVAIAFKRSSSLCGMISARL